MDIQEAKELLNKNGYMVNELYWPSDKKSGKVVSFDEIDSELQKYIGAIKKINAYFTETIDKCDGFKKLKKKWTRCDLGDGLYVCEADDGTYYLYCYGLPTMMPEEEFSRIRAYEYYVDEHGIAYSAASDEIANYRRILRRWSVYKDKFLNHMADYEFDVDKFEI